jgi:hypothetical protein
MAVSVAKRYGLDRRGSFPGRGKIFLFLLASRPPLGPTQPPTKCAPGENSPEVERPGSEAVHSPQSSSDAKNSGAIRRYVFVA